VISSRDRQNTRDVSDNLKQPDTSMSQDRQGEVFNGCALGFASDRTHDTDNWCFDIQHSLLNLV